MENLPSTSSSSQPFPSVYDVFINHRGPDKSTLAQPLYDRLRHVLNLKVFLDKEELQPGDPIASSIAHAIKNAKVQIAIFSKRYAESRWCLDELCLMLDRGAVIIPVFYNVKPSDLRWIESGVYKDAFEKHASNKRYNTQILQKWKEALNKVSYRSGLEFDSKSTGDEGTLLQEIVKSVSKHVKMELEVADHEVGLDEEVKKFETTIAGHESEGENMVKVVGIVGMGGSGKTTLARKLHNRKKPEYHNKSCFLFDVRESSATKGLHYLQRMLLKELGFGHKTICSRNHGKEVLRKQLRGERVLIILDDIDHADQLEALLVIDVLGSDSLVLITSRYRNVLTQCGISILYEKKGMERNNGRELFCCHAFQRRHPMDGFEDLVERFLDACSGLPLSLKVIGRQLRGKREKSYWEGELRKIRKILPDDIKKILKISYDALDEEQKQIFLDIACFFVGEKKSTAASVWEASEWDGSYALEGLQDRCLVEFYEHESSEIGRGRDTFVRMHDHLRDMGRDIAKSTQSLRFRRSNDNRDSGSNFLELIKQPSEVAQLEVVGSRILNESFEYLDPDTDSHVLQFLAVDSDHTRQKLVKLLWLRWMWVPSESFPSFLSLENLRVLEICHDSLKELWDERTSQAPQLLRELYIMSSVMTLEKITKSIASLKYLRKLVIDLVLAVGTELPDEFCRLLSLEHLELRNDSELESLPNRFGDLTNLQHLDLSNCQKLRTLPNSFNQLTQLRFLSLSGCSSLSVPQDMFRNISTLKYVDFSRCENLEVLPISITRQGNLKYLSFTSDQCTQLPDEIGELKNLEDLHVCCKLLPLLPSTLGKLCRLKHLNLIDCPMLKSLPKSVGHLKRLETLDIDHSGVEILPEEVAHLNNLQELSMSSSPIWQVTLRKSELSDQNCMSRLKHIKLRRTETTVISIVEDVCPNLSNLEVEFCQRLKDVELALPTALVSLTIRNCMALKTITGLSNLAKLQRLEISDCDEVERLPNLAQLTSLNELVICGCEKLEKIEGAGGLSCLKVLDAKCCWNLQSIEGLDRLQVLNLLQISSSDEWTDIEGLLGSSTSIVTSRRKDDNKSGSNISCLSLSPTTTLKRFIKRTGGFDIIQGEHTLQLWEMEMNTCTTLVTCVVVKAYEGGGVHSLVVGPHRYYWRVKEGKWINVGVFTNNSEFLRQLKAQTHSDSAFLKLHMHWCMEIEETWAVMVGDMVEERENISNILSNFLRGV